MADYREEQEMEAEALTAIFDTSFHINSSTPLHRWSLTLQPYLDDELDDTDETTINHISIQLNLTLPKTYPDVPPEIDVRIVKGLAELQRKLLIDLAIEAAETNVGMVAVYAIAENLREWLCENNVKGLEDESMHAQMMRRTKDEERLKAKTKQEYESQNKAENFSAAELEDLEVRKRRAEGTPCNEENFERWKAIFDEEMAIEFEKNKGIKEDEDVRKAKKKGGGAKNKMRLDGRSKKEEEAMEGRLTGFEYFNQKVGGVLNLDALEKAAEEAAAEGVDDGGEYEGNLDDLDEDLFDDEDDLDDLDFDSDDEDDEDDVDI